MAAATLTGQLTSGQTYTQMSTTAMPQVANTGEIMFVSQGLVNVEIFVLSSPIAVNDTTVHVVSQVAAQTHLVGENVTPKYTLTTVGRSMAPIQTPRLTKL